MTDPRTPDVIEVDDTYPDTPGLDAWVARHPIDEPRDHAQVHLRHPSDTPGVYIDAVNRGTFHDPDERLPAGTTPDTVMAHLHAGSALSISAPLAELEVYVAALGDCLAIARWQATQLAARGPVEAVDQ